jgi:hypothetical protein
LESKALANRWISGAYRLEIGHSGLTKMKTVTFAFPSNGFTGWPARSLTSASVAGVQVSSVFPFPSLSAAPKEQP